MGGKAMPAAHYDAVFPTLFHCKAGDGDVQPNGRLENRNERQLKGLCK
jgi:hypothetical protein